ncbi:MAG: NAD-dependent epimerase/dehydratase family protein [Acidaminococcaceae bacterium]|nr:NAD-dependent epimerase/dehydratase family protein [Acidaminococcaceae bacterium]
MWTDNRIFLEDLESILARGFLDWRAFRDKSFFITGATGLIGYTLCSALLYAELKKKLGLRVIALARNTAKAREKFQGQLADGCPLSLVSGSVEELPEIQAPVDFIVHCAAPTASGYFVSNPVETIRGIAAGTDRVLHLARQRQVEKMVYLSSMEVYGEVGTGEAVDETEQGFLDPLSVRSSYPQAKRLAESCCIAYAAEYGVPVVIARLAQTFGPGAAEDDSRVFAYIGRRAAQGQEIRLNTSGAKENMYLYTADAVSAILLMLLKGEKGAVYNAANPGTYCSVKELAQSAAEALGNGAIPIVTNCGDTRMYPPESRLYLNTEKLQSMGWTPGYSLRDMFLRMRGCFDGK